MFLYLYLKRKIHDLKLKVIRIIMSLKPTLLIWNINSTVALIVVQTPLSVHQVFIFIIVALVAPALSSWPVWRLVILPKLVLIGWMAKLFDSAWVFRIEVWTTRRSMSLNFLFLLNYLWDTIRSHSLRVCLFDNKYVYLFLVSCILKERIFMLFLLISFKRALLVFVLFAL